MIFRYFCVYFIQIECAEYRGLVNETLLNAADKETITCEISTVPLIIGGEYAKPREFPHMVCCHYYDYLKEYLNNDLVSFDLI